MLFHHIKHYCSEGSTQIPAGFKKEGKVLLRLKLLRDLGIPKHSYRPGNGIWGNVGF